MNLTATMMMMDIGMFGHGHHNQHNGAYATDSNYYSYTGELCSPNHGGSQGQASSHYATAAAYHYEDPAYVYGTTDSSDTPPSPQDLNYYHQHHQAVVHQDNPIINTEAGLSYTNLDYSNSNGTIYHQNMYPSDGFPRSHSEMTLRHQEEIAGDGHQMQGYQPDSKYLAHDLDASENFHPHLVAGNSSASSCMEYQHLQRYKQEGLQVSEVGLNRLRPHHVIHGLNSLQQNQPALPTYKWMQVKRNVPKPVGKRFSFHFSIYKTSKPDSRTDTIYFRTSIAAV